MHKYYLRKCFELESYSREQQVGWLGFVTESMSQIGIELRHHSLVDFLMSVFEKLLR